MKKLKGSYTSAKPHVHLPIDRTQKNRLYMSDEDKKKPYSISLTQKQYTAIQNEMSRLTSKGFHAFTLAKFIEGLCFDESMRKECKLTAEDVLNL